MKRILLRGAVAAAVCSSLLLSLMWCNWDKYVESSAFAQTPAEDTLQRILGTFVAELLGSEVVPPVTTNVSGAVTAHFHNSSNTIDVAFESSFLAKANVTGIEIRQGAKGSNSPGTVLVNLYDPAVNPGDLIESTVNSILTLTLDRNGLAFPAASVTALTGGNTYVLVRTTANPSGEIRGQLLSPLPTALGDVPVPLPPNIGDFVKDNNKAILLGKALFWDMQVGSDGRTACATCHFHSGVDVRTKNAVGLPPGDRTGITFRGANSTLAASDYPFHKLSDPDDRNSTVLSDTGEITGSQGVIKRNFSNIVNGNALDAGTYVADTVFKFGTANARQVEPRNTPTTINAVFNDRNFWDGRANRFFNGVNPFGNHDPSAKVWEASSTSSVNQVSVLLDNASLASQAVGPPLSDFEMSWNGRNWPQVGKKMLQLKPLAIQKVDPTDSVLGASANTSGKGLVASVTYPQLIRDAFHDKWWKYTGSINGFSQMEANFSLFWGLSILMYERTLVSDDAPFDRFANKLKVGDEAGARAILTAQQIEGLDLFLNDGKCINCHKGAEFTGAAISQRRNQLVEHMIMGDGQLAFYDGGFYNIAVRPTAQDVGVGGSNQFGALSLARRKQLGQPVIGVDFNIGPNDRLAVDGAFKTPTLRNIELTGPYFHNGGQKSLEEVIQFYVRGTDFRNVNIDNLDPDVEGIPSMQGQPSKVAAMAAFLRSLTDERVRYRKAPFDHPELLVPNGHTSVVFGSALDNLILVPATGRNGGTAIKPFIDILNAGGFNGNNL